MVCSFELGLTFFYWIAMHKSNGGSMDMHEVFKWLLHSAPLVFWVLEIILQRWTFRRKKDIWTLNLFLTIYGLWNFTCVKYTGVPVYPVLKFESFDNTLKIVVIFFINFSTAFLILYYITNFIQNPKSTSKSNSTNLKVE